MISMICELIVNGYKSNDGPVAITDFMESPFNPDRSRVLVSEPKNTSSDNIRLIMISGPSSSGKTTFAKKL